MDKKIFLLSKDFKNVKHKKQKTDYFFFDIFQHWLPSPSLIGWNLPTVFASLSCFKKENVMSNCNGITFLEK